MKGEPLVILLVEDNPAHAELIMRILEEHRVVNKIHHVSDGEAALAYLFRRGTYSDEEANPRPHLVLLDLRLPRIDGLEVLKEIKTSPETRLIPVVVLTTSEADRDVTRAYDSHANSYLVKPVEFHAFTKLLNDLGFYWLAWNKHPNAQFGE